MNTQQNESLTVIERIHKELPYLNPALRRIAEFVLENQELCKTITIKDLAAACDVAESSVTRFVKEIGLQRYQDLKIGLAEVLSSNDILETAPQEAYKTSPATIPIRPSSKKLSTIPCKLCTIPSSV